MISNTPEGPKKSGEMDEMREIRLRETVDETLPAILEVVARELPRYAELGMPEEKFSYRDDLKFLQIPDLTQRVKDQMYNEWRAGDPTLTISFLAFAAARGHLHIQDVEQKLAEAKESGITPSDKTEMFFDLIRNEWVKTEDSLVWLLEHSETLGKRYSVDDLRAWVKSEEELIRRGKLLGIRISAWTLENYKVFDRILSENFQKADRGRLRAILDQAILDALIIPQINFVETLRGVHGSRENLVKNVQPLLFIYHIRKFVDQVIPGEKM